MESKVIELLVPRVGRSPGIPRWLPRCVGMFAESFHINNMYGICLAATRCIAAGGSIFLIADRDKNMTHVSRHTPTERREQVGV